MLKTKNTLEFHPEFAATQIKALHRSHLDGMDIPTQFQLFSDDKSKSCLWKRNDRGVPIDPLQKVLYGTLKQLQHTLMRANESGAGVFLTVNRCEGTKRNTESVTKVRAVCIDGDADKFQGNLKLEPSFTVYRGDSFHAYWLVKDMELEQFGPTQLGIATTHGTDHITDLPRVLRLAGFYHQKGFHQGGVSTLVVIDCPEKPIVYTTEQIHEVYPMVLKKAPKFAPKEATGVAKPLLSAAYDKGDYTQGDYNGQVPATLSLTLQEVLDRAFSSKNGPKLERLYNGDTTGYNSQSEADLALYGMLNYFVTPEHSEEVFRSSALMRDKWDERRGFSTYGEMTRNKALETWNGKVFTVREPRVGIKPQSTIECAKRYESNIPVLIKQGFKGIKIASEGGEGGTGKRLHSSTTRSYESAWLRIVERMKDPINFRRNDSGELILTLGGLQKAELLGVGNMKDVAGRYRVLAQGGFVLRIDHLDPTNKKSELVAVLPDNFEELLIFSSTLEDSKRRIKLPPLTVSKSDPIDTSIPCDTKSILGQTLKARTIREEYPLRRASSLCTVLHECGPQTFDDLKEISAYTDKGLKRTLDILVDNGCATVVDGTYNINWSDYIEKKISESENSVNYRNRAIGLVRESIYNYSRIEQLILKYGSHTAKSLSRLADARKKLAYHRERLERLNDGEPVWVVFDLYGDLEISRNELAEAMAA